MALKREPWLTGNVPLQRNTYPVSSERPIIGQYLHRDQTYKSRWDIHYPLEFGIVMAGRVCRWFPKFESQLDPGQVWLHGMWEPHAGRILKTPCALLVVFIWPPLLTNLHFEEAPSFHWMAPFIVPAADRPQVPQSKRNDFVALGRSFADLLGNDSETNRLRMRLLLIQMLGMLMADWQIPRVLKPSLQHYYSRINPVIDLVLNSHQLVTMDNAARACAMGRKQFGRLFRQLMGISFPLFALRHRLSGAKKQLLATDVPLKTIAGRWGFTDESYFRRVFIKHYGCTPHKYRKRSWQSPPGNFSDPVNNQDIPRFSGVKSRNIRLGGPLDGFKFTSKP